MKYLLLGATILFLASCSGSSEEGVTEKYEQPFMRVVENSAPEITNTKQFDDCVAPTIKMCITQTANEIARKENSLSLCEKLQNETEIQSCKYGVIITKLSKENILSLCDSLDEKYRIECRISSFALKATSENDPDECNQIAEEFINTGGAEDGNIRIDQCKLPLLLKKADLKSSDCDDLYDPSQKKTCLSMIKPQSVSVRNKK